jgi:hypothetical protein
VTSCAKLIQVLSRADWLYIILIADFFAVHNDFLSRPILSDVRNFESIFGCGSAPLPTLRSVTRVYGFGAREHREGAPLPTTRDQQGAALILGRHPGSTCSCARFTGALVAAIRVAVPRREFVPTVTEMEIIRQKIGEIGKAGVQIRRDFE